MKKKIARLTAAILVSTMLLSSCATSQSPGTDTPQTQQIETSQPTAKPADAPKPAESEKAPADTPAAGKKIYRYADSTDSNNLSPHMSLGAAEGTVVAWTTGLLYRRVPLGDGKRSEIIPEIAAADPIQVDDEGKVWNIELRKDITWVNGDPINADTFMYSYKMCLDPLLANQTAKDLMTGVVIVKNAEAYYQQLGEGNPEVAWEDVGIKKLDDYTLQITTEGRYTEFEVKRHFLARATCPVYEPLYESLMNAERTSTTYGTDLDKLMSSGPYTITSWTRGSERIMSKNENWVLADYIKLDEVHVRIVEDANTRMQMFENGEADYISLNQETYLTYEEDPRVRLNTSNEVISFDINAGNTEKPILGDKDFRQAMYYGVNREELAALTKHKAKGSYLTENAIADPETGAKFWDVPEAKATIKPNDGYDPVLAKELFDKAMATHGLTNLKLTMIYSETSALWKLCAEYLQASYAEIFGPDKFQIELVAMPYAQAMSQIKTWKDNPNAYELAWCGWVNSNIAFNPTVQFQYFDKDYFNLNGPPVSEKLSEIYRDSLKEEVRLYPEKLVEHAIEMEKIMIEEVVVVPVVNIITKVMYSDRMIIPFTEYEPNLGWGPLFGDIDLTK